MPNDYSDIYVKEGGDSKAVFSANEVLDNYLTTDLQKLPSTLQLEERVQRLVTVVDYLAMRLPDKERAELCEVVGYPPAPDTAAESVDKKLSKAGPAPNRFVVELCEGEVVSLHTNVPQLHATIITTEDPTTRYVNREKIEETVGDDMLHPDNVVKVSFF